MAGTSSMNCLSCKIPYQCLHSLAAWTPFSEKALFFTDFCFVASPSQNSVPNCFQIMDQIKKAGGKCRPVLGDPDSATMGEAIKKKPQPEMAWFGGAKPGIFWGGDLNLGQNLEGRNLLKLRRLDPSCPAFLNDKEYLGTTNPDAPNAMIARLKQPSRPPNAVIAEGRNRGKTPNAIIAWEKRPNLLI